MFDHSCEMTDWPMSLPTLPGLMLKSTDKVDESNALTC